MFHANRNESKARAAILKKINFKTKKNEKNKQTRTLHNYKGSIQQEDIIIINTCTPNIGASRHIKQLLMDLKGENHSNTIIVLNNRVWNNRVWRKRILSTLLVGL